jgi:hypothetical protein
MFAADLSYPLAVVGGDEEGLQAGFEWCAARMDSGDVVTLYVPLKSSLRNSALLQKWSAYRDVEVVTSRGSTVIRSGPVLAVWPDMDDLGKIARNGGRVRALCVSALAEEEIAPWVAATRPEILGEAARWANDSPPALDPVVEQAMEGLTLTVNHNNTIAAGFEKEQVVGVLLMLKDANYHLDGEQLQGWALAHGWTGKNPQRLAGYVEDINSGKRPRVRSMLRRDYLDYLRRKAAGEGVDQG